MVFAKVIGGREIADRAIRRTIQGKSEQTLLTRQLVQAITGPHNNKDNESALRHRHKELTSSNALIQASTVRVSDRPPVSPLFVDVIHKSRRTAGTWASAMKYMQQHVVDPGKELTCDHVARILSLWASDRVTDRPPLTTLLQWWTVISLERPTGMDSPSNHAGRPVPSLALRLLPVIAAAMADGGRVRAAMDVIATEATIAGNKGHSMVAHALESCVTAAVDPHSTSSTEQKAIESCLASIGGSAQITPSTIPAARSRDMLTTAERFVSALPTRAGGQPSFAIVFSEESGTLTKSAVNDEQRTFNGIASAIVAAAPTSTEGIRLCDSFIGMTTPNTSTILRELKLRLLYRQNAKEACEYFDSIPVEQRTPLMCVLALRYIVSIREYESAIEMARHLCETWGSFTLPCSVVNTIATMRSASAHSDSFWMLADRCRVRVTSVEALNSVAARPAIPIATTVRNVPFEEVFYSLKDLVEADKINSAKLIVERLPSIPRGRLGSERDTELLDALAAVGDDWELALDLMRQHK